MHTQKRVNVFAHVLRSCYVGMLPIVVLLATLLFHAIEFGVQIKIIHFIRLRFSIGNLFLILLSKPVFNNTRAL